jgi:hypothetical protein
MFIRDARQQLGTVAGVRDWRKVALRLTKANRGNCQKLLQYSELREVGEGPFCLCDEQGS